MTYITYPHMPPCGLDVWERRVCYAAMDWKSDTCHVPPARKSTTSDKALLQAGKPDMADAGWRIHCSEKPHIGSLKPDRATGLVRCRPPIKEMGAGAVF